jgi:hypothetical protein
VRNTATPQSRDDNGDEHGRSSTVGQWIPKLSITENNLD